MCNSFLPFGFHLENLENDTLKVSFIVTLRDFNFRFYGRDHCINVKASNNT
jgi:hypothetical protein